MTRTKATKTSSPATETPSSSVPASSVPDASVTVTSSETPVATKAPRTKKPKASVTASVETPVVVAPTASVTATTATTATESSEEVVAAAADAETPIAEQSTDFVAKLQQAGLLISALKVEYRAMERRWSRELKAAQKQSSRRKRKAGNRAPSGFVKPTRISDDLASFLGKEKGTEMARTAVTHDINTYIRDNNLQNPSNGRIINPDQKLSSLLKLSGAEELTYFNLQRYMSPHFAKSVKAVVAAAAATSSA
jgi:upstream activation factor subunit UAF30